MRNSLLAGLLFLACASFTVPALAWDHSIEVGYAYSHDPNHTKYDNSGVLVNGDLWHIGDWWLTRWSIFGSVGQWWTTTPINRNLTTVALDLTFRLYPFVIPQTCYPFYLFLASGPAYLSSRHFGLNTQAYNFAFQSNIGFGAEFNNIDVNLRWQHYSNARLGKPNEGFNFLYLLSVGYLF
jgi:hypothetical protein